MAKPLFQDIIPPDRRSIKNISRDLSPRERARDIPVREVPVREAPQRVSRPAPRPEPRREAPAYYDEIPTQQEYERSRPIPVREQAPARRPEPVEHHYDDEIEELYHTRDQKPKSAKKSKKFGIRIVATILVVVLIMAGAFWAMSRVSGATVTLTPKAETVSIDSQFTAQREAGAALQFQIVTYAKDGKLSVASTGQEQAQTKASGIIIIYNSGTSPQTLIASTRFATDKGLIFRISQAVTVPARTIEGGKTIPGSVEAAITADAIGPEYNVGLADFTVPGLKGDPRFDLVVGRTKPQNPIQGGFSGLRNKVDESEMTKAREKVRNELKANSVKELEKYIPQDYIMPNNGYVILYESLPDVQETNGVKINERATFNGFIFKKTALAQEISQKVRGVATQPSEVGDIKGLSFSIISPTKEPWSTSTIQFSLKGTTSLVSTVDIEKLKNELIGKPRTSLKPILSSYPAVTGAEVTMRPFWKRSFPENKDEITLQVVNPQP